MAEVPNASFTETQRFRMWWLRVVVLIVAAVAWFTFIVQIFFSTPVGNNPAPDGVVWLTWLIFGIGFPWMFHKFHMTTTVSPAALMIQFSPFPARTIPLQSIRTCETRTYRPLWEYGGWGVRWSPHRGMAYNVSGNRGVQLELTDGKRILIGSQEPERLEAALSSGIGKN